MMDKNNNFFQAILKHPNIFLAVVSALVFLPMLGSYPVLGQWEPHYGRVAVEMLENNSWDWFLDPVYLGKHNFWSKPIFCFWMVFPFIKLLGPTELALRLPFAINGILFVLLVHYITLRLFNDPRKALFTGFITIFIPFTYLISRQFMWDITFVTFLTGATGFLYIGERDKDKKILRIAYVFMGLGMLTKGLLAFCIPGAVLLLWYIVNFDGKLGFVAFCKNLWKYLVSLRIFEGIGIFVLVAAPWYIYMGVKHGVPFYSEFFLEHHFGRLEGTIDKPDGPLDFYIWQLSIGAFPWIGFIFPALFLAVKRAKIVRETAFVLFNFFFLFALYTIAATKFPHYIFPIVPYMAMILADCFISVLDDETTARAYPLIGLIAALLIALIAKDLGTGLNYANLIYIITTHHVQNWFGRVFDMVPYLYVFTPILAVSAFLPVIKPTSKMLMKCSLAVFVLTTVAWSCYINFYWVPNMLEVFTPKHLVETYKAQKQPGDQIVDYDNWKNRSMYFYLGTGETLHRFTKTDQIINLIKKHPKSTIFITTKVNKASELRAALFDKLGILMTKIADDKIDTYMEIEMYTVSMKDKDKDYSELWKSNLVEEKDLPKDMIKINSTVGNKTLEIMGYTINKKRFDPGEKLVLTVYYKVLKKMADNWQLFFHFDVYNGVLPNSFKHDDYPQKGYFPTTKWEEGMILKEEIEEEIPKGHPGGGVKIYTGFYNKKGRMSIDKDSFNDGQKRFILGTFNVNIK